MRVRNILGIAVIVGLLWWVSTAALDQYGVQGTTTTIDVRDILGLDPAPEPEPPVAEPAPVPDTTGKDTRLSDVGARTASAWAHITSATTWLYDHALALSAIPTALAAAMVLRRLRGLRKPVTDPVRAYSSAQRTESFSRAGDQCEYTSWGVSRCTGPAEHADHLYPWSKGGATSLANCVASCAHHNTSKGAKILPWWKVRWLESRRRRYFPPGVPVKVGQRYDPRNAPDVVAPPVTASPAWPEQAQDGQELAPGTLPTSTGWLGDPTKGEGGTGRSQTW